MTSKKLSSEATADLDLPTSERDVEALRRARTAKSYSLVEALPLLARMEHLPPASARRDTSDGWVAFSLE